MQKSWWHCHVKTGFHKRSKFSLLLIDFYSHFTFLHVRGNTESSRWKKTPDWSLFTGTVSSGLGIFHSVGFCHFFIIPNRKVVCFPPQPPPHFLHPLRLQFLPHSSKLEIADHREQVQLSRNFNIYSHFSNPRVRTLAFFLFSGVGCFFCAEHRKWSLIRGLL